MVRTVEPTRLCTRPKCPLAGQRQPWSNFYAAAKWPDGTMRRPQSWCKACANAASKANPEPRRRYDRRRYARIRKDPELWADRLEDMRFQYRARRGVTHQSRREFEEVRLASGPFLEWLRTVVEREHSSWTSTCARLGVDESVRRCATVDLLVVERALTMDDTKTLRELYSDDEMAGAFEEKDGGS
jgi:hypothetical protein